jgi:hypothetical protein
MAHRILNNDKQEGTFQAWHGLTHIRKDLTIENNWLSEWDISPQPLFYGNGIESGFSMLQCTDDEEIHIGYPYNPETFHPISNKEFLDLIMASTGGAGHEVVSVGSVRNRGRTFMSLALKGMEEYEAAGRKFSAYLSFLNGHDKSSVLAVVTSNLCTVCDNCYSSNLFKVESGQADSKDDISVRVRHSKNSKMRFPEIAQLIDSAIGVQAKFKLEMDKMFQEKVSSNTAKSFITGFLQRNKTEKEIEKAVQLKGKSLSTRSEGTIERIENLFLNGKGNNGSNKSDLFSAFTDYYTHESSGGTDRNKQFVSSEFGAGLAAKQGAYRLMTNDAQFEKTVRFGEKILSLN